MIFVLELVHNSRIHQMQESDMDIHIYINCERTRFEKQKNHILNFRSSFSLLVYINIKSQCTSNFV